MEVNQTLMKIIDKRNESTLLTRVKYVFNAGAPIQGNKENDGIYFYRSNSGGTGADIFYVEYYFKTFKVNEKQVLKITSQLNPVGLLFTAIIFSFTFWGLLNDLGIGNHDINLLSGFLISMCFYGVVYIAYKMNRDSTVQDIVALLKLEPINIRKTLSKSV